MATDDHERPGGLGRRWSFLRRPPRTDAPVDWLIVGLGNPGARYEGTRHNVGRAVVEAVALTCGASLDRVKHRARFGRAEVAGARVVLATPTTYMNESGEAVAPLARFYRVAPSAVVLVHDDLDLPLGRLRIRSGGGAGGHNGVASVVRLLGTDAVPRLRVGIGRPPAGWDAADYVLARFSADERPCADEAIGRAVHAIESLVREGVDGAMNAYN
jgi:peptidyl-tRNA hydrolase, PTH1 family